MAALDMWTHEFCLTCDRQVQVDGDAYCSEACRMSDFEKTPSTPSSQASSPGFSPVSYARSGSLSSRPAPTKFFLSPAYDFNQAQPYGSTPRSSSSFWQLHVRHVASLFHPGPHPLELTQQPLLHAEHILYRRGEPAVRQGTHGTASIRCFLRAGQTAAPAIILSDQHHHTNSHTHIPHTTLYHLPPTTYHHATQSYATQSYATQYETTRNHPTITCYTVVLLKQALCLLPLFYFISLELYQDGRYTEHRIPIKALFCLFEVFLIERTVFSTPTSLLFLLSRSFITERSGFGGTPLRASVYHNTTHKDWAENLISNHCLLLAWHKGNTFGCWRATHYDIWDMISGADQDFGIRARMMAQIKAVGVLQSRPVYGNLLVWTQKKKTKGRRKGEKRKSKTDGFLEIGLAQAEDALHHQ